MKIKLIFVVVALVLVGIVFVQKHNKITYKNDTYGYAVTIPKDYKYREQSGSFFVYNPKDEDIHYGLTINIIKNVNPSTGWAQPDFKETIGGRSADVFIGKDGAFSSRKSYQIFYNDKIYEITFSPAYRTEFEEIAQSFRFTK